MQAIHAIIADRAESMPLPCPAAVACAWVLGWVYRRPLHRCVFVTSHPRYVGYVRGPDPLRYGYFDDEEKSLLRIDTSVPEAVRAGAAYPYVKSSSESSPARADPNIPKAARPLVFDVLGLRSSDWIHMCKNSGKSSKRALLEIG